MTIHFVLYILLWLIVLKILLYIIGNNSKFCFRKIVFVLMFQEKKEHPDLSVTFLQ